MKLAILSLCFLLVGFACAAPAYEQAVPNKRSAENELAEVQDFLSALANMQQDEEEGAIQQDEEEPDQASIEEFLSSLQQEEPEEQHEEPDQATIEALMSYLQQDEEEPDQATIEEFKSYLQQMEPEERAKMEGWFGSFFRKIGKGIKKAFHHVGRGFKKAFHHVHRVIRSKGFRRWVGHVLKWTRRSLHIVAKHGKHFG